MDTYVINYIKQAITEAKIAAPDKAKMNGSAGDAKVVAALDALYTVNSQSGFEATKEQWDTIIAGTIPELASIVNKPRRLWHIDDLAKRPPQQWLIPNKILANGITAMYGPSEAGKSFLAVDYAAQVAMKKPIIYIAAEGQSGYYARYKAWCKHNDQQKSGQFHLYEEAVQMLTPASVDSFILEAQPIKPAMVVVDTLIRCFEGGDENQSKDVNMFTASCNRIQKEFNCAVLIIHHVNKGSNSERGSGALRNNCDSMIEVQHEEGLIRVICSKTKDIAHWPTEHYRRMPIEVEQNGQKVQSCVLEEWQNVKVNPEELTHNQLTVLTILGSDLYADCGARASELVAIANISRSTLHSVMTSLKKRGLLSKPPKRSDPYSITEQGKYLMTKHYAKNP